MMRNLDLRSLDLGGPGWTKAVNKIRVSVWHRLRLKFQLDYKRKLSDPKNSNINNLSPADTI